MNIFGKEIDATPEQEAEANRLWTEMLEKLDSLPPVTSYFDDSQNWPKRELTREYSKKIRALFPEHFN